MHNKKQTNTNKQSQKKMTTRCSYCREMGHNSRGCNKTSWEAAEMKISYARVANLAIRANKQRLIAITAGDFSERSVKTIVIDSRDREGRVMFMTHDVETSPVRLVSRQVQPVSNTTNLVPKSLVKIQEILFDNSQDLPDGLYKQLMDALVIKG